MSNDHLDAIARREAECYPAELVQGRDAYAAQLAVAGQYQYVLLDEASGETGGHAVIFAIHSARPPELSDLPVAPASPSDDTVLYVHDVSLDRKCRGHGHVARLLALLPRDVDLELVAVHGAEKVWKRHGFQVVPCKTALASYGHHPLYMRRAAAMAE